MYSIVCIKLRADYKDNILLHFGIKILFKFWYSYNSHITHVNC